MLAFSPRHHLLDVVQAPDQTGPETKTRRAVQRSLAGAFFKGRQAGSQSLVDHPPKRPALASRDSLEPRSHIIIQRQRRPHIVMLEW